MQHGIMERKQEGPKSYEATTFSLRLAFGLPSESLSGNYCHHAPTIAVAQFDMLTCSGDDPLRAISYRNSSESCTWQLVSQLSTLAHVEQLSAHQQQPLST